MTPPPRAMIFGPTDRTRRFDSSGGLTIGVGLTPIGWLSLIGSDASKAANAILPLGDELGDARRGDPRTGWSAPRRCGEGRDPRRDADRAPAACRAAIATPRSRCRRRCCRASPTMSPIWPIRSEIEPRTLHRVCQHGVRLLAGAAAAPPAFPAHAGAGARLARPAARPADRRALLRPGAFQPRLQGVHGDDPDGLFRLLARSDAARGGGSARLARRTGAGASRQSNS